MAFLYTSPCAAVDALTAVPLPLCVSLPLGVTVQDRIATIKFPNGHEITLPYDEQSTLKSLLPVIAETNKLLYVLLYGGGEIPCVVWRVTRTIVCVCVVSVGYRLHSADYVFCVPNSEMKRLKVRAWDSLSSMV